MIQTKDILTSTRHKPNTQPNTELNTNLTQTRHKLDTNNSITSLVGNEKILLYFVYEQCKLSASLITGILTFDFITHTSKINKNSIKTTLNRLAQKNFIRRVSYKDGRGGWVKFQIDESTYQHLMQEETRHKPNTNLTQTKHKVNTQPNTQPNTNLSSSSSSSKEIFNTTTTDATLNTSLSSEWEEVDLKELQKRGVPFSKNHMVNLWEFLKGHSAFEFQESIDGYVYDIDNNHVQTRRGYLNLLIGTIRNGQLYVSSHYVSPEMKKINEMIELNKQRKAELESFYQAKEEEGFLQWMDEYGRENIKKQLPVNLMIDFEHKGKTSLAWVKQHLYQKAKNEN